MEILLTRCWINQPSTNQREHKLHGVRVLVNLAQSDRHGIVDVWFLEGPTVSSRMFKTELSRGWPDTSHANTGGHDK